MRERLASDTAERVTFVRALESRRPESERICYDPLAEKLLGPKYKMYYGNRLMLQLLTIKAKLYRIGVFEYIVSRTRFIDECVQTSVNEGLEQMVVLGAGYDSRAYRIEGLKKIKVFEVDHPATQRVKVRRIRRALVATPDNVVYVGVNFDREPLKEKLLKARYDPGIKTLFVWEGVTYYLSAEAVDATLAFVSKNSGPGSGIVFDYVAPGLVDGTDLPLSLTKMLRKFTQYTEPLKFGIKDAFLDEFLAARGFQLVQKVSRDHLKHAYFHGMNRSRPLMQGLSIAYATVLPRT